MIPNNLFLSIQTSAAIVSLLGAILVVCIVLFIIGTSSVDEEKHQAKGKVYKLRVKYFYGLMAAIVLLLFFTMQTLPYFKHKTTRSDEVVTVVGAQWAWKMDHGTTEVKAKEFEGLNDITLPSNKVIQFNVMSADVNHNFAIYNDKGDIVAQTQAMPNYTNHLQYTFEERGEYHILCLEYCGMAHAYMTGSIHIE
ncbi:MAG: hypothetical protein M9887_12285 [Chitinophagales bacterium]|nr:hypothetical protein [Chitinophagales bacterium]